MDDFDIPELIDLDSLNRCIPVTILTGFLGSGKTTLLNYLLRENHGKRIAVIENEFSQGLGIEGMIAKSGISGQDLEGFFELNNGCICCTVKDSLLTTLEQLAFHKDKFDYILIETTGVANPGPIISSFWLDQAVNSSLKLDGVVCVVDSLNIERYLKDPVTKNDCTMQICYADRILLNKIDLVDEKKISSISEEMNELNPLAQLFQTSFSKVSTDCVLGLGGYSEEKLTQWTQSMGPSTIFCAPCVPNSEVKAPSMHVAAQLSSISCSFVGTLNLNLLQRYLDSLLYADQVYDEKKRTSSTEVIVTHPESSNDAMDIYRMKGIVHIEPCDDWDISGPCILQAVHDIFDITPCTEKVDFDSNYFVVIGKNLDSDVILHGLQSCLFA